MQPSIAQTTEILVRRHRIRPGDVNDFSVRNLSQIADTAEGSSRIMAILLAAVASISLVVGGIGIRNILLVSVTEPPGRSGCAWRSGPDARTCCFSSWRRRFSWLWHLRRALRSVDPGADP